MAKNSPTSSPDPFTPVSIARQLETGTPNTGDLYGEAGVAKGNRPPVGRFSFDVPPFSNPTQ